MNRSLDSSTREDILSNAGAPSQSSSFLRMVVWMLVRRSSSFPSFLKSKKNMLTLRPLFLPHASMSSLRRSKPGSSTSTTTFTVDILDIGSRPVGTSLAILAIFLFLNMFFILSNIVCSYKFTYFLLCGLPTRYVNFRSDDFHDLCGNDRSDFSADLERHAEGVGV